VTSKQRSSNLLVTRDSSVIPEDEIIRTLLETQLGVRGVFDLIQASMWNDDDLARKVLNAIGPDQGAKEMIWNEQYYLQ
jgi:hypothetical protein